MFQPAQLPLGRPLSQQLQWLRRQVRQRRAEGGDWRDVVDGLRPHVRQIWQAMSPDQRARFLRHGAAWWEVHRHRVPPASDALLSAARLSGQIELLRGAFLGAGRTPEGRPVARIRPAGSTTVQPLAAGRIVDCRGIRRDPEQHGGPLLRQLLQQGLGRIDGQRLGLDVDGACRVIAADGTPQDRLLAIGPASRAAFWEITAIPDIRLQAQHLAQRLIGASAG